MNRSYTTEEVKKILEQNEFYIYGYGRVAKRFFAYLKRNALSHHVLGFITTNQSNLFSEETQSFVRTVDEIDSHHWVMVAVDVPDFPSIRATLDRRGFDKYIHIFFHLTRMTFGDPIRKETIEIDWLMHHLKFFQWVPAMYILVIEHFFQKRDFADAMYIKFYNFTHNPSASQKSLQFFKMAIEKCSKEGFHQDYSIMVNSDYTAIFDGSHRMALAIYFGNDTINADIYNVPWEEQIKMATWNGKNVFYDEKGNAKDLREAFTETEAKEIERSYEKWID